MSWLSPLHLAISAAVLVIFAIWMIGDGVVGLRRMLRK
jgi:hypothetical protein